MAKLPAWATPGDDASDGQAMYMHAMAATFFIAQIQTCVSHSFFFLSWFCACTYSRPLFVNILQQQIL